MTLLTGHLDSSKKMQESLLEAIKGKGEGLGTDAKGDTSHDSESLELTQKNQELLSMNNNLSQQIV